MATADGAQRKPAPFAKAAGGAARVRSVGGGCGAGAVAAAPPKATATATTTATKPAGFTFNMKKPPTATRAAPLGSVGAKAGGRSTSGVASGAVRVPVFGKKPSGATSTAPATASTKAPFAMPIGAKTAQGKDRAVPTPKQQPRVGGAFRGFLAKNAVEMKTDMKLSCAQEKTTKASGLTMNTSAKGLTGSVPTSFSRVKVTPQQGGARNRDSALPATAMLKDSKAPRFQLKSTQQPNKMTKLTPTLPLNVNTKKFTMTRTLSTTKSPTETQVQVQNHTSNAASTPKKRLQALASQAAGSLAKKPRVEIKPSISVTKSVQELNVVSPEPRARHYPQPALEDQAGANPNEDEQTDTGTERSVSESAVDDPARRIEPWRTFENDAKHIAFESNCLTSSTQAVFVTAEENELASFTFDAREFDGESEDFLQRVRGLQLFVDDVNRKQHLISNQLIDANALVCECLLDVITDATALGGGVKLLEVDELSSTAQHQFDDQDSRIDEVAFPW